jgi:hypothetical protein
MESYSHDILAFADLMDSKGYKGYFHSPLVAYDFLAFHLKKCTTLHQERMKVDQPFVLATFSTPADQTKTPVVKCCFHTEYDESKGFRVRKVNLEYVDDDRVLRKKELLLKNNSEIPSCEQVGRMMKRKRGMGI